MPTLIYCPQCEKPLRVPDHGLSKKVRCPTCTTVFVAEPPAEVVPTPPPLPYDAPAQAVTAAPPLDAPLQVVPIPGSRGPRVPPRRPAKRSRWPLIAVGGGLALLITGGVVAALLLRGGGERPAVIADHEWQPFAHAEGRFEVLLPGRPVEQIVPVQIPGGVLNVKVFQIELHDRGVSFALNYQDIPGHVANALPLEQHFQNGLNGALTSVRGKLRKETSVPLGSHPGREWVIEAPAQDMVIIQRSYLVRMRGTLRVYSINIGARGEPAPADAKKFFDSFRLTGLPERTLPLPPGNSDRPLGMTPDGKTLVSADTNFGLRVWDVARGTQQPLMQPGADVHGQTVLLTADGQNLLLARRSGVLLARGLAPADREVTVVPPPEQRLPRHILACSGDGKTAFFSTGNVNSHLITLPGMQRRAGPEGYTRDAALSHDGKLLAALSGRYVHLIETGKNEEVGVLDTGGPEPPQPAALAFSPDGKHLAMLSQGRRQLRLWDAATRDERFRYEGELQSFAFSPDSKRLAAAESQSVRVWDLATGNESARLAPEPGAGVTYGEVLFTPDGSQLIVGTGSAIEFWDVAKISPPPAPQPLRTIPPPGAQARDVIEGLDTNPIAVHITPDSKSLVAFGDGGSVLRWELPSGRIANATRGAWQHNHPSAALFSPDGKTVYFEREQQVLAREWKSGKQTVFAKGPDYRDSAIALSGDGSVLATGHFNGWVRAWDTAKGVALGQAQRHRDRVTAIAVSPDGKTLASASPEQIPAVRLTDVATGNETALIELGQDKQMEPAARLAFSPDGKKLACTHGMTVSLIDITEREVVARCNVTRRSGQLKFSPKGERLATTCDDGSVWVWETASGRGKVVPASGGGNLAFTADGERLALVGNQRVRVLDLPRALPGRAETPAFERVKSTALGFDAQGRGTLRGLDRAAVYVGFRDGGKRLAAVSDVGTVRVWELPGGKVRDVIAAQNPNHTPEVVATADGGLIVGRVQPPLDRIDLKTRATKPLLQAKGQLPGGPIVVVAVAPDGKAIATGHFAGFRVWNEDGTERHALETKGPVGATALRFTSDGKALIVGGRDGRLRLWDPASGKELPMPLPQRTKFDGFRGVNALDFSPDGTLLLAAWDDGEARVFRLADRTVVRELKTGTKTVRSAAFAPDGKRLALGRGDGKVELFDADGNSVAVLATGQSNAVRTLAFSPDGALLAAGVLVSNDVELWDLSIALKKGKQ